VDGSAVTMLNNTIADRPTENEDENINIGFEVIILL